MDFKSRLAEILGIGSIAEKTMLVEYVNACKLIAVEYHQFAIQKENEWVSVEDGMPDQDGESIHGQKYDYQVCLSDGTVLHGRYKNQSWNLFWDEGLGVLYGDRSIVYWRKLPNPPKDK